MNLSIVNSRDDVAPGLLDELRLMLVRAGVPSSALAVKPASKEHMSIGTVLGIDIETALFVLGAASHLASFAHCVIEWSRKHEVAVRLVAEDETVEVIPPGADLAKVSQVVLQMRDKAKS